MIDAKVPYVLVVKFSYFSNLKKNVCAISKLTLVVCIWLIFKFDFDFGDNLYQI
jgi:hypothetical protein